MIRPRLAILVSACLIGNGLCSPDQESSVRAGPAEDADTGAQVLLVDYMGQPPPGLEPVLFAPGVISTSRSEIAFEMSPDGEEMYFVRFFSNSPRIMFTRHAAEGWTAPALVSFTGDHSSSHPSFSADGNTLFFSSKMPLPDDWPGPRPAPDSREAIKIWQVTRQGRGWGSPRPVFVPRGDRIADASVSAAGTIYASGIVRSVFNDGQYSEPEGLTPHLEGYWPHIAPDESYIIYGHGFPRQLLVSFQREDGTWTEPRSCSDDFGFEGAEMNGMPFVTPDGKFLFFSAKHDIYWVDAQVFKRLKSREYPP